MLHVEHKKARRLGLYEVLLASALCFFSALACSIWIEDQNHQFSIFELNLTQVQEHAACSHMISLYQSRDITRVRCIATS